MFTSTPEGGIYSCVISLSTSLVDGARLADEGGGERVFCRRGTGSSGFRTERASRPFCTVSNAGSTCCGVVVLANKWRRLLLPRLRGALPSLLWDVELDDEEVVLEVRRVAGSYAEPGVTEPFTEGVRERGNEEYPGGGVSSLFVLTAGGVAARTYESMGGVGCRCEEGGVADDGGVLEFICCWRCIRPRRPLISLVPADGMVLNCGRAVSVGPGGGGVSPSDGVSRESELRRDVRFGGPSLVNRPRRGYRVVLAELPIVGCLPDQHQNTKYPKQAHKTHSSGTYEEDNLTAGVVCCPSCPSPVIPITLALLANELTSFIPNIVLPALTPKDDDAFTGVFHRSRFSLPWISIRAWAGLGVRSFNKDFTYSDSNWNSPDEEGEGGIESAFREEMEFEMACRAVIYSDCEDGGHHDGCCPEKVDEEGEELKDWSDLFCFGEDPLPRQP